VFGLALALTACGGQSVTSGKVVAKDYTPEFSGYTYGYHYCLDGKWGYCWGYEHDPARWRVTLERCDPPNTSSVTGEADGKVRCYRDTHDVAPGLYDALDIGETINLEAQ